MTDFGAPEHRRGNERWLAADSEGGSWVSADDHARLLAAERALADDQHTVLAMLDQLAVLQGTNYEREIERVMARHRQARER